MAVVYFSLGSNQGDRFSYLQQAVEYIDQRIGPIQKTSSYYETEPWGFFDENSFINQVITVNTELSPFKILERAQLIEKVLGRQRETSSQRYSGRTLDVDILFIDDQKINTDSLSVPHPFMHQRRFVLEPLNEIAPDFIHPSLKKPVLNLLLFCNDAMNVKKLTGKDILSSVA